MALKMQVTLLRVGRYVHPRADERTESAWSDEEVLALAWLERRFSVPDLSVILSRSESSIEQRQQATHGASPIEPVIVETFSQAFCRAAIRSLLYRERAGNKWTSEEDAVLRWLATRYSIFDLHVILRRSMSSIEKRLLHLGIDYPGTKPVSAERLKAAVVSRRTGSIWRVSLTVAVIIVLCLLSLWLGR